MMEDKFKDSWFFPIRPINPRAQLILFLFHYSGGSASQFRHWSKELSDLINPIGIQLPGRENRFKDPLFFHSRDVIEALIKVFPNDLDKPFILFGHSMGAALAFEFARMLEKNNYSGLRHLIVSGRGAPHIPSGNKKLYNLPKKEFIQELIKYNGLPEIILESDELLDLFIPTIQSDFTISDNYQYFPTAPLSCPITAFGGIADPYVSEEKIQEWKHHTNSSFNLHTVEGDHFFLIKESSTQVINQLNKIAANIVKDSSP